MSKELEIQMKRAFADRLVNHVFPLFVMNLSSMGLPDEAVGLIVNALLDAFKEDDEIMKESSGKSKDTG